MAATLNTTKERCWMRRKPFYQCCCRCVHHLEDKRHCTIDTKLREEKGGCVCSVHKGYVCAGFASEGTVHSDWPKHSIGCEMFFDKRKVKQAA